MDNKTVRKLWDTIEDKKGFLLDDRIGNIIFRHVARQPGELKYSLYLTRQCPHGMARFTKGFQFDRLDEQEIKVLLENAVILASDEFCKQNCEPHHTREFNG